MISKIVSETRDSDLTMSGIASRFESAKGTQPIDQEWLRDATQLLARLKQLKWKYTNGTTGNGR